MDKEEIRMSMPREYKGNAFDAQMKILQDIPIAIIDMGNGFFAVSREGHFADRTHILEGEDAVRKHLNDLLLEYKGYKLVDEQLAKG